MTDNKNVVVRSEQHLMVQVEAANTRLAISSQLTQDVERRRFVEILKRIDKEDVVIFLSENTEINEELLEKFKYMWYGEALSKNALLPWSLELIERFEGKRSWQRLSRNEALPWSLELIERLKISGIGRVCQGMKRCRCH